MSDIEQKLREYAEGFETAAIQEMVVHGAGTDDEVEMAGLSATLYEAADTIASLRAKDEREVPSNCAPAQDDGVHIHTAHANPAQVTGFGADKIATWPPLKKAIWDVVTFEQLNDGHYINAYDLTDKLHFAVTAANPAQVTDAMVEAVLSWVCDDVLPAYDVPSDVPRNDPELPDSCRAVLTAAIGAGVQAVDPRHFEILAEAMAEVKATSDGLSDQPIADIVQGCIDEIAALPTHPAPSGQAVAVKALKWKKRKGLDGLTSPSDCGIYDVGEVHGRILALRRYVDSDGQWQDMELARCSTVAEAKAAAQADYERRILSTLSHPPQPAERVVEALETYYARQIEWSRRTFGPATRTKGILDHIRKELDEIAAKPDDLSEWVDVVILAMDGFWRHGGGSSDLMPALLAKQQKNIARTWPDWRTMSEDKAIEHDRSGDAALAQEGRKDG